MKKFLKLKKNSNLAFTTTTSISSMSNREDKRHESGDYKSNHKTPMSSQPVCIRDSSQPDNQAPPYSFSSGDEQSDDDETGNSRTKSKEFDDDEFFDADEGSYRSLNINNILIKFFYIHTCIFQLFSL